MTDTQATLQLARDLLSRGDPSTAGLWPRAAALLIRQALEEAVDAYWTTRQLPLESVSTQTQLVCLRMMTADARCLPSSTRPGAPSASVPPPSLRARADGGRARGLDRRRGGLREAGLTLGPRTGIVVSTKEVSVAKAEKKTGAGKANAAFMKPVTPSAELAEVIGSTPVPRPR